MDESLRLVDLIPRRVLTFGLLLTAGLAVVAGLETLYAWSSTPTLNQITTDGTVAAFDLDGEGSLAVWFSSVVLMLAASVAVLVYTIRRHKADDYRGYYRIWLWAAWCWLLMSIDETSSLHEGFMGMMTYLTGTSLYGDGSVWWMIPYFFLLGAVGSRLFLDMRPCRLSRGALLVAAGCYAGAVGTQVLGDGLTRAVMLEEGAEMVGNLFLLLAMGLHARYVILEAEGLLPRRAPPSSPVPRRESEGPSSSAAGSSLGSGAGDRAVAVDSPHNGLRGLFRRRTGTADPQPAQSPVPRKLTKAEKKALRKRLIEQRLQRQRAQQGGW